MRSETLVLPLMMYGKDGKVWHKKGEPMLENVIVGYDVYKTGAKKGKREKPIYEWRVKTKKSKVVVGYDGVFTRGKNKGKPKPITEVQDVPVYSEGLFPTVNHIYVQIGGRASRRLKPIAEKHLNMWKDIAIEWQGKTKWETLDAPFKAVVELFYYLPSKCTGDTHNSKKLLLDALEGIIHNNDFYMLDRTVDFDYDDDNPRIEIRVSKI